VSFTVPDLAAATYPAQAGLDAGDLAIMAGGSALTGVVSGCAVTPQASPNMTAAVAAGVVRYGGRRVTVTGGNVTVTAADATNPRHDLVTVDTTGALAVVAGTPAQITATSEPVYPAIPVSRVVLASVYVPANKTTVDAGMITDKRVAVAEPPPLVADYVIYVSGGTTYAVNGSTGYTDFSGTDPGAVLTSVIGALGTGGGCVTVRAGSYTWASIPALPAGLTGWLRIIGEPGAKISLTTTAPRFLDFNRTGSGITFQYLHVEGFTIDAAALSATGSGHHMVLGTWTGNSTITGQDVHFDHITVYGIRTVNVRTALDATAQHFNVWIVPHVTNNATQYKLTNIRVEQCEFNGGNYGVGVYGNRQSGFTGADADIWEDNIVVKDIYHDTGSVPAAFGSFANVHLGSGAKGGTCWVERIYGKNSWDVGVEIDNFETAHVRDCSFENVFGFAIAITNFVTVPNLKAQTYYLTNITQHRTSGSWSSDSSSVIGMVQSNNGAGTPQTFGRVIARNVKMFRKGSSLDTGAGIEGDLAHLKLPMIEFMLDGAQYQATGLTHTTGSPSPTVIFTSPTSKTKCSLRNIDVQLDGTLGVGSSAIGLTALYLSGQLDLLVDNVSVNAQLTNVAAFSIHGMDVGSLGSANINGIIRGFRCSMNDTGGRGIVIDSSTNLTIPSQITMENCDFTGMPSGTTEITWVDTTNKAKTVARGTRWITYPKAVYTITAPTSATATRWNEGYDGTLLITAGTVSNISIGRDGTNFTQIASATGVVLQMQQGDYYRITYSVAPTLTVLASR
jgi:hypothetical protein